MAIFSNEFHWYVLPLNPEPWAIGPVSAHKGKGGKGMFATVGRNTNLFAYQEAVRSELTRQRAEMVELGEGHDGYEMVFVFFQLLEEYLTPTGRKSQRHAADLTNMVKATEDACQGILIDNDKKVMKHTNYVQRTEVQEALPYVIIGVAPCLGLNPNELPAEVWEGVDLMVAEHKGHIGQGFEPSNQPWSDPNHDIIGDIKKFGLSPVEDVF